jgi:hypothetical protein
LKLANGIFKADFGERREKYPPEIDPFNHQQVNLSGSKLSSEVHG